MNLNQSSEKKRKKKLEGKGHNCYYHPHWRWMIWNPPIWSWWMVAPPYSGKWVTSPTKHLPLASLRRRRARSCPNLTTGFNGVWKEGAPGVQHHTDSEAVSEFSLVPVLSVKTTPLSLSLSLYIYIHTHTHTHTHTHIHIHPFSIFLWVYFNPDLHVRLPFLFYGIFFFSVQVALKTSIAKNGVIFRYWWFPP